MDGSGAEWESNAVTGLLLARGCGIRRSATSRSGSSQAAIPARPHDFGASPDRQPNRRTNTGLAPSSPPSPAVGHSPFRRRNGVVRNRSTETTYTTIAAKFAHYEGMRCRAQHNPKTPRQLRSALFMENEISASLESPIRRTAVERSQPMQVGLTGSIIARYYLTA